MNKTIRRKFTTDFTEDYNVFVNDFIDETVELLRPRFKGIPFNPEMKEGMLVPSHLRESNDKSFYIVVDDFMVLFAVERRTEWNHREIAITRCIPDQFFHEKPDHNTIYKENN